MACGPAGNTDSTGPSSSPPFSEITSTTSTPTSGSSATGSTGPTVGATTTAKGASTSSSGRDTTTTTGGGSLARFVTRGPDNSDKVALTFHTNGDLKLAQRILDIFKDANGAVFTSFIVGNWLAANPSWAAKLTDAGHELANHTYTHPDFAKLSPKAMADEIARCRDAIKKLRGGGGRFFRPSGTDDGLATPSDAILRAAADAGYDIVLGWDDEPFDFKDPGPDAVRTRVLDQLKGGSIVSLHFGHPGTIDALPAILDGVRAKHLTTVTASTLLS